MGKLVAAFYLVVGLGFFLVATSGLRNTSETALVNGVFGVVPGFMGFVGGMIGRRGALLALLFGFLFVVGTLALMVFFFRVLWPRL
jgi:hypothetical protein